MGRFWSLLFLLVPILGVATFVFAIAGIGPFKDHWLPSNINQDGAVIDGLFMFVLYLTGAIFVGTGIALFYYLWKYDAERSTEPVKFVHGSHMLEVVWSILPAATLLFIAIYQMNAWADTKMRRPITSPGPDNIEGTKDDVFKPPLALVTGYQFGWRVRYPGADGELHTSDDIVLINDLHVPVNEEVTLAIQSDDVLHSFFLPNLRVKQDVVPGMKQYVWFKANRTGSYDIVCAELCGWGHYKMKGRITVDSKDEFEQWMATQTALQTKSELNAVGEENE